MASFHQILNEAIADFEEHGYDSEERLEYWRKRLSEAADAQTAITPEAMKRTFTAIYSAQVINGGLLKTHKIADWELRQLAPKLRVELERKIMASAQLIKLNREEMISRTIRRFTGWATSIPVGGSEAIEKRETSNEIKKSLKQLPFTERRVMIDQAAKFNASLSNIVAVETGAIAAVWKSHWRAPGYNYRKDHKERDGVVYLLRDNWAMQKGLVKLAGHQYTDEITMVAEEPYCSCKYKYLYNLRDLPEELLTEKGRASIGKK